MGYMIDPDRRKPPGEPPQKPKRPLSRQKLKTMDRTAVYNAIRDVYLEENPKCCSCGCAACEVHHICRGANRGRSLLNVDTWLGLCGDCHRQMDNTTLEAQIRLKLSAVRYAIGRLRK
jgi:5-methylcytosine-specific restriction endonuclease McrA